MSKKPLKELIDAEPFTHNHVKITGENAHFVNNLAAMLGVSRRDAIRLYCVISEAMFITLASGHEVRILNTGRIYFRHRPWAKIHRPTGKPTANKSGYKTYWTASTHLQQFFNQEEFKPHHEVGRFVQYTKPQIDQGEEEPDESYQQRLTRMAENQAVLAAFLGVDAPNSAPRKEPSEEQSTHTQEQHQTTGDTSE